MKKSLPSGPEAPPRATPAPPGVFSEGVLNLSGGNTYSGTPLATALLSLSPQLCTRDQLSLWGQGRFCKLFCHGFHAGPLPSQHLWWEKHSRRTTGFLQIDTDKNSPAGLLYPVGPGPAWHDQAQPGAPLREGGTEGGETESQCREQLERSKQDFRPGEPKQTVRHICLLSWLPGNKAALFHVVYQPRLVFRTPGKGFFKLLFF